jgi:hypothetical protein
MPTYRIVRDEVIRYTVEYYIDAPDEGEAFVELESGDHESVVLETDYVSEDVIEFELFDN